MEADAHRALKEGVKWMWSLGDYTEVARRLQPYAEALVEALGIRPGMRVLDVAAGNGNFALAAARRGASVTASDLTPAMVALGRARSSAEGLAITWHEADAEALPFATDGFDVVASVFGAMFAPQPERVAAELFRVARPGGIVAMANYASAGCLGEFAALITRYAPQPATPLPSPFMWGDPDVVRRRFQDRAEAIALEERTLTFTFATLEQVLAFWERTNGPLIALKRLTTSETYAAMRAEAAQLFTALNRTPDGDSARLTLDSDYLQVIAHKNEA